MTNNTQPTQQVPSGMAKSVFLANAHYFYAKTDGTYAFPNSAEGDLLKQAKLEIEELRAVLAAATPGQVEDRRDAERWRVWIESVEGSCGNEDARHLEEIMDACRAKALIGLSAIEAALSAAGTRFASVSEQKGEAK